MLRHGPLCSDAVSGATPPGRSPAGSGARAAAASGRPPRGRRPGSRRGSARATGRATGLRPPSPAGGSACATAIPSTALNAATASSGAPACSRTSARSRDTGIPALRSRANCRRRSSTLVVTATARLHPARTSVPIRPSPTTRPNSSNTRDGRPALRGETDVRGRDGREDRGPEPLPGRRGPVGRDVELGRRRRPPDRSARPVR